MTKESYDLESKRYQHTAVVFIATFCSVISSFLFGYSTGIINGANLLLAEEFHLGHVWVEAIVSSAVGAAAIFSLLSAWISDTLGRKITIMMSAMVFTVGGVLMGFANGPEMLLIGRIVVGSAIGVVSSVVPVYVSECSPPDIRGSLITLNQLFITIGIWASSILAGLFQSLDHGWRYMLGLSAIPGLIQFVCFICLPESPRWSVMVGKYDQGEQILKRIRGTSDVKEELEEIKVSIEKEKDTKGCKIYKNVFTVGHVRKALIIGCMLQLFQQFCGINTVIYYSANILKSAGFDVRMAIWLSVIPTTVNFLATFIGVWAVEALGRTKILAYSYLAIAVALIVLVIGFLVPWAKSPVTSSTYETVPGFLDLDTCSSHSNCYKCTMDDACGFCYAGTTADPVNGSCVKAGPDDDKELYSSEGRCAHNNATDTFVYGSSVSYTHGYCPTVFSWLAVAGLILFVLGFAPGAGPMPWTINAEIYPLWARSVANSLSTFSNWVCNYIVSMTFLTLSRAITPWGAFLIFTVFCILGALFTLVFVPETKDKSLEEVECLFMSEKALAEYNARMQAHHLKPATGKNK